MSGGVSLNGYSDTWREPKSCQGNRQTGKAHTSVLLHTWLAISHCCTVLREKGETADVEVLMVVAHVLSTPFQVSIKGASFVNVGDRVSLEGSAQSPTNGQLSFVWTELSIGLSLIFSERYIFVQKRSTNLVISPEILIADHYYVCSLSMNRSNGEFQ